MKQSVTSWRLITTTEHPPAPRLTEARGADVGTPSRHSLPPNERHRVQGQDRRRSPPRGVGGTRTCDKRTPRGAARTSGEEVDGAEQGTQGNEYRARRGHRSRPPQSNTGQPGDAPDKRGGGNTGSSLPSESRDPVRRGARAPAHSRTTRWRWSASRGPDRDGISGLRAGPSRTNSRASRGRDTRP